MTAHVRACVYDNIRFPCAYVLLASPHLRSQSCIEHQDTSARKQISISEVRLADTAAHYVSPDQRKPTIVHPEDVPPRPSMNLALIALPERSQT